MQRLPLNTPLLSAGLVLVLTGAAHSWIGEVMIFRKVAKGSVVPNQAAPPLQERNLRILWATWHLASVFGFALAASVISVGRGHGGGEVVLPAVAAAAIGGGVLVLYATRGKHPGWVALCAAGILTLVGM